ncbi:transposase [Ensifer sp. ENS09]|uniref:transposase n=1 Tax=Ensifer sp. ENS09 TaxID=2769263 RepID=UPI00352DC832
MRVEILGQERRRRWGDEHKLDIVMSVGVSGATVTEVAHRHDVTRQQIHTELAPERPGHAPPLS